MHTRKTIALRATHRLTIKGDRQLPCPKQTAQVGAGPDHPNCAGKDSSRSVLVAETAAESDVRGAEAFAGRSRLRLTHFFRATEEWARYAGATRAPAAHWHTTPRRPPRVCGSAEERASR